MRNWVVIVGVLSALVRWSKSYFSLFEYHKFPFDISLPLPKDAFKEMIESCALLTACGANYRITDGTALGLYRGGSFIAHDNDIDIDILDCVNVRKIIFLFLRSGYSIGRFVYTKGCTQQITFFNRRNVIVDLVYWKSSGDTVVSYSEPEHVRQQLKLYFQSKTEYRIEKGVVVFLPGNIENWLESRYGPDWRTPKTYKGDWKHESSDIQRIKHLG